MEASTSSHVEGAKERDQRIQSARKKLKSYRAKQAQMEKKRVSLIAPSSSSCSSAAHLSLGSNDGISASAVLAQADAMAAQVAREVEATSSAMSHTRTSSRAGHGRGHSRTGSISIAALTAAAPPTPVSRPQSIVTTAFVAATPKSHVRTHSRSASRAGQRPASMLLSATNSKLELTGGSDWKDVIDSTARPVSVGAEATRPLSTADNTPRLNAAAPITEESSAPAASSHARKASRHSRRTSVSTRRESMEIMGGLSLGFGDMPSGSNSSNANNRNSRRFSSNRHSGIMSASVLFGGPAEILQPSSGNAHRRSSVRQDFDWRVFAPNAAANEDSSIDDSNDRLTALEKLEGRSRSISPAPVESTPPRTPEGASASNRRHSRQTSVQLPSFDDVHGAEAMDRRASLTLLESNQATTLSERPLSQGAPRSSLGLPLGAEDAINATSASSSSSGRPSSIRLTPDATPLLEGLGTLVEEEEEEEDSTTQSPPQGKRTSLESDGAEDRRKRKQAEQETIKRNRRGSLTPRPLKLKSRPASLFVGTQLTYGVAGLSPSASLPHLAAAPDTAGSESQFADYEDASTVDSSEAASTPRSAAAPFTQAQQQQPSKSSTPAQSPLVRDWSLSGAQQKLASARANVMQQQSGSTSATPDMKRSWRSSLPASSLAGSSSPASAPAAPVAASAAAPRQGMRALRLGSGSISSPAQHTGPSESVSSAASFATSASSSTNATPPSSSAAAKRLSMSVITAREEIGAPLSSASPSSASATSTMAKRRSSIGYRSSASGSSDTTASPLAAVPMAPPAAAAAPISVAHAVYEELKSAHMRTNSLLDTSRKQVERLTRELAVESERSAREYAELERWSAEEKRTLGTRIEHLESSASSSAAVAEQRAAEAGTAVERLEAQLRKASENLEDLTAERDMLQDDVDGWRTRCGDLEKTLRTERTTLDEERRLRTAAKARAKMLFEKLEAAGIEAPPTPVEERTFEDGLPTDLVTALRSPALGSASPVIGASGGYFSPATPAGGVDGAPHPHAVKLLKDMRQQIFNLAGSLEHERSEHVKAKLEADALRAELAALKAEQQGNMTFNTVSGGAESEPASPPRSASISSAPGARNSKPKRHVFAYDSSMGSNSMSMGSVSIATTAPSSAVPSEQGHGSRDEKDDFASASQSFATSHSEDDLAGLGMGGLQTLAETEEEEGEALSDAATPLARSAEVHDDAYDVEAALEDGRRESESDSVAPSTPGLDHSGKTAQAYFPHKATSAAPPSIPVLTIEGVAIPPSTPSSSADHSARSSESSMESHGPASPPASHADVAADASAFTSVVDADASTTVVVDDYLDELEELDDAAANPSRPEFIREWSFELATAAIKAKQQKVQEARRARQAEEAANAAAVAARRPRRRQPSIEDFFGLMRVDAGPLPALPVPDEALEMPPVYVDQSSQYSPPTSVDYRYGAAPKRFSAQSAESYDHSPRVSMRVSTGSVASSNGGARRNSASLQQRSAPPVARSAMAHNTYGASEDSALISGVTALPGAVLSRMSLTGLTSAFSGLGGYLSGQSAAIQVAAAATKACTLPAAHDVDAHGGSISWSAQRSVEHDEEDGFAAQQAARRW